MKSLRFLVAGFVLVLSFSGARAADMSASQAKAAAKQAVVEMKGMLQEVLDMLAEANEQKDVNRINCLNPKITSIKGLVRIGEQAVTDLMEAVAKNDEDNIEHNSVKVDIARQKVKTLHAEASTCSGESGKYSGDTKSEVEVDEEIEEFNEEDAGGGEDTEPPSYEKPVEPQSPWNN